jgi:predicted HAD superfamily phosphohydrolase
VEEEGRFGHTDFFLSLDASKYMSSIQKEFEELKKKYKKGNVPEEVKKEFFEKVDKERANAPAEEFFEVIDDFFTRALEES